MSRDWIDPDNGPTPEQLGAYADGEVTDAGRDAVDVWLRRHPSQAAEVEALRRLTQLWHDTPPPSPGPEAWAAVRGRIETALNGPTPTPALSPRRRPRYFLGVAAAAVLALVFLSRGQLTVPEAAAEEEPFQVVGSDDVAIMCIGGDASECLVGAQPPVRCLKDCDLVKRADVVVFNIEPHEQGDRAEPRYPGNDDTPLMITPRDDGWQRDP